MKYTRKEMIKKGFALTLACAVPQLVYTIFKNRKEEEPDVLSSLPERQIPDVMLLDESSVENFDWLLLRYNKETDNAPTVVTSKTSHLTPKTENEFKILVKAIKQVVLRNGMYLYSNMEQTLYPSRELNKLIKSIEESCISEYGSNELSEDLYRPVAFIYAELSRSKNADSIIA